MAIKLYKITFICMFAIFVAIAGQVVAEQTIDDGDKPQEEEPIDQGRKPSITPDIGYQLTDSDYQVLAKMPQVPAKVYAHKAIPVNLNDNAYIKENNVTKAFNFTEIDRKQVPPLSDNYAENIITMDSRDRSIEYFGTGAIVYMESDIFSEDEPDLLAISGLSIEEAKSTFAKEAINFLKTNKLYKDTLYLREVSFATLQEYDVASKKVINKKTVGAAVHYGYTIDGIKTYGPGAKVSVLFGSDMRITSYLDLLRQHQKSYSVDLIDPLEAVDQYISYHEPKTLLRAGGGIVKEVLIDSVQLVYNLEAVSVKQAEIQPYYLIVGRFICDNPDGGKPLDVQFEWLEDAVAG